MRKIGLVGNLAALGFVLFLFIKTPLSSNDWTSIIVFVLIVSLLVFNNWYFFRPIVPKRKWWIFSFLERKHLEEEIRILEANKRLESLKKI